MSVLADTIQYLTSIVIINLQGTHHNNAITMYSLSLVKVHSTIFLNLKRDPGIYREYISMYIYTCMMENADKRCTYHIDMYHIDI